MPAFYALTAPKFLAVIHPVLNNQGESERALKALYVEIYNRSQESAFGPTWSDLLKLARRHALDFKLAGGPIKRAPSHHRPNGDASGSDAAYKKTVKTKGLKGLRRKILNRILDSGNSHHKSAAERLKSLDAAPTSEGGAS